MIRWRMILTRVLIVAAVLALFHWTAGPIVGWCMVRTLQTATGARVDLDSTHVGLFPPRVQFLGLQLADPRKEMENVFQADAIELLIDGRALLQRRYEVAAGKISGIRIGSDRTESGRLEVVPAEPTESGKPSFLARLCGQWLDDARQSAEGMANGLQTVQEAKRIRDRWEAEYAELRARARRLEEDVRTMKSTARSVENPLRDLPALQEAVRRGDEIRKELISMRQQSEMLPERIRTDMLSLDRAKRADQQRAASYLPAEFEGSPDELARELLGEIVRDQVQQVREYLETGRSIANATVSGPEVTRERGETILLGAQRPQWLIQQCEIDGWMTVNREPYRMVGTLENVSSQTDRLEGPMRARLQLDGPRVVRIDYRRSYGAATPFDHLRVHWPRLDLPAKRLGGRDASLTVDGGQLELWVELEAAGDQIQGRLVSKQSGTSLGLATKPKFAETVVVQSLQRSLSEIDHVDVDAKFAGTWRRVNVDVRTNLISGLSHGLQTAVSEQVAAAREKLAGEVHRAYDKQKRELQEWLSHQQNGTRDLLAKTEASIEALSQKLAGDLGTPDAYLGRLRSGIGQAIK